MVKIEGFRERLHLLKRRETLTDYDPALTGPEATALVANDALNAASEYAQDQGTHTEQLGVEIKRRKGLIYDSPARRSVDAKIDRQR